MLVILQNKRKDWNACKKCLIQTDTIEKLANVTDELAKSLVEELQPFME